MTGIREDYIGLLRSFLDQRTTPEQFESLYLEKVKTENRHPDKQTNELIQILFSDVDAFVNDPDLYRRLQIEDPDGHYVTLEQLRKRVEETLLALQKLS